MPDGSSSPADIVDQAQLREALNESVEELYLAFSKRRLSPHWPSACTDCCASPESMARVSNATQRTVTFEDLDEYLSAAKAEGVEQDLAYLLPRIMEFTAQGREPKSAGLFATFAHYFPPMWQELTSREQNAVSQYGAALARWRLNLPPEDHCEYDFSDILEMYASGGLDIFPMIEVLAHPLATTQATSTLIDLINHHSQLWREGLNGFYEISDEQAAKISAALRTALSSPEVLKLLEQLALSDSGGEFAEKASLAHHIAETMRDD